MISIVRGEGERPKQLIRARSEHQGRQESYTQDLLFYSPDSSTLGDQPPLSTRRDDASPEHDDADQKTRLEERILQTELHQDLLQKLLASWEDICEDCMEVMNLGEQAVFDLARKKGTEWARQVASENAIAARRIHDHINSDK